MKLSKKKNSYGKSVGKINAINASRFVLKTKYDTVGWLKKQIVMLKL